MDRAMALMSDVPTFDETNSVVIEKRNEMTEDLFQIGIICDESSIGTLHFE